MAQTNSTRSFLLLIVLTLLFSWSTSRPVDNSALAHDLAFWRRQHGGVFSVLGIVAFGDGTPHPRLEIRELQKNKDQWNVFLLGLHRFQSVDQNDRLSYFKIAGKSVFLLSLIILGLDYFLQVRKHVECVHQNHAVR